MDKHLKKVPIPLALKRAKEARPRKERAKEKIKDAVEAFLRKLLKRWG